MQDTSALRANTGVDPVALAAVEGVGRVITVTIPIDPPSECFPNKRNRRGGFDAGNAAAARFRMAAKAAAISHAPRTPITGPIHLSIFAAYGHGRRLPDLDATLSAVKSGIDALADAQIFQDDRQVTSIAVMHEKLKGKRNERPQGWTQIHVAELEAGL